ncbi:MAG: hypothetical protein HY548_02065, partial [Elusimicrobia bacterium]|nr:hypothetical protein [Elusimicrobiota bacterium]
YDAFGNLVDYEKEVTANGAVKIFKPVLTEYDDLGRAVDFLESVKDKNTGETSVSGLLGAEYNELGQQVTGSSVNAEAPEDILKDKGKMETFKEKVLSGAFEEQVTFKETTVTEVVKAATRRQGLRRRAAEFVTKVVRVATGTKSPGETAKELGLSKVSVTKTLEPNRYDTQGRLVYSKTKNDEAAWNKDRKDTFKFDTDKAKAEAKKKELEKAGYQADVTYREEPVYAEIEDDITGEKIQVQVGTKIVDVLVTAYKEFDERHTETTTETLLFDVLNRPVQQMMATQDGSTLTQEVRTLTYNPAGQAEKIYRSVTESGKNADGTKYSKTFLQDQAFTYNAKGQISSESFRTYNESGQETKEATLSNSEIAYNDKGQRVSWTETISSNASTSVSERKIANVTYDLMGRQLSYDQDVFENGKLQYTERGVTNAYDNRGRLILTSAQRTWGTSAQGTLWALSVEGGKSESGGGGGLGLEGWTSGNVQVVTDYQYANPNSNGMTGTTVRATGTGTNADGAVQAQGINYTDTRTDFQFNSYGQTVSYRQSTTQVMRYSRTESRKNKSGMGKKSKTKEIVGLNTVDTIVSGIEFDSLGRQVFSRTSSFSHGARTFTNSWSRTRTFDEQGRAKDVETWSETKTVTGQKSAMISGKHVSETRAYRADGTLDEARTRRNELGSWSKSYDRSSFTKTMQAASIVVAVAIAVLTAGAGSALIAMAWAAAGAAFQMAQSGISLHDLGVGGRDRAGAKQRAMGFWTSVASVATAGLAQTSFLKSAKDLTGTAKMLTMVGNAAKMAAVNAGLQMGVAKLSGADNRTVYQVGTLAAASGALQGLAFGGVEKAGTLVKVMAGTGEAVSRVGSTYGNEKQRSTWVILGSAISSSGGGIASAGQATASAAKQLGLIYYEKSRQKDGVGNEDEAIRRSLLTSQTSGLIGSAAGYLMSLKPVKTALAAVGLAAKSGLSKLADYKKARKEGLTVTQYQARERIQNAIALDFAKKKLGGLMPGFGPREPKGKAPSATGGILPGETEPVSREVKKPAEVKRQERAGEPSLSTKEPAQRRVQPAETQTRQEKGLPSGGESKKPIPGLGTELQKQLREQTPAILPLPGLRLLPGMFKADSKLGLEAESPLYASAAVSPIYQEVFGAYDAVTFISNPVNMTEVVVARVMDAGFAAVDNIRAAMGGAEPSEAWGAAFSSLSKTDEAGIYRVENGKTFKDDSGKIWEGGSQFVLTERGLQVAMGVTFEANYQGLRKADGGLVPVIYQLGKDNRLSVVGVDFERMETGTHLVVNGLTVLGAEFSVKSGGFTIGEKGEISSFDTLTAYKEGKEGWKMALAMGENRQGQTWDITMDGDGFSVVNPSYALDKETRVKINATFKGSFVDGAAMFEGGRIEPTALSFEGNGERAKGISDDLGGHAVMGEDGVLVFNKVKFDGNARVDWPMGATGKTESVGSGAEGKTPGKLEAIHNTITVTGYDAATNKAMIKGVFMMKTDAERGDMKVGFGIGTSFDIAEGVGLKAQGMTLHQNGSHNLTMITDKGLVIGEGVSGKVDGSSDELIFGKNGEAEVRVTRVREGDRIVRRAYMAGSGAAVSCKMDSATGKLQIDAVGGRTLSLEIPDYQKTDQTSRWHGLLTAKDMQWGAVKESKASRWIGAFSVSKIVKSATNVDAEKFSLAAVTGKIFRVDLKKATPAGVMKALQPSGEDIVAVKGLALRVGAVTLRTGAKLTAATDALVMTRLLNSDNKAAQNLVQNAVKRQEFYEGIGAFSDRVIAKSQELNSETTRALVWKGSENGSWDDVELKASKAGLANLLGMFVTLGGDQTEEALQTEHGKGLKGVGGFVQNQLGGLMMMVRPDLAYADRARDLGGEGGKFAAGARRVALAETGVNVAGTAFVVAGIGISVGVKGRAAWIESRKATVDGFVRMGRAERAMNGAFAAAKDLAIQGVDNALPGLHVQAWGQKLEMRALESHFATNNAAAKTLGLEGAKGFEVIGVRGDKVVVNVNGEGVRSPTFQEAIAHINERALQQGLTVDLGVMDPVTFRELQNQGWFLNNQSERGYKNVVMHTEKLKTAAEKMKVFAETKIKEKESLSAQKENSLKKNNDTIEMNERQMASMDKNKASLQDLSNNFKEQIKAGKGDWRGYIKSAEKLAPGWKPGPELVDQFRRAEEGVKGNRQGPGEPGGSQAVSGGIKGYIQKLGGGIRAGLERVGLKSKSVAGSKPAIGEVEARLQRTIAASRLESAASRLESAASRLESAASDFVTNKISELATKNDVLVKVGEGLRQEISAAHAGAKSYRRRADAFGKGIAQYDGALKDLAERIKYLQKDTVLQQKLKRAVTFTSQMNLGEVKMGRMVRNWKPNADGGLNPAYAPVPFNANAPKAGAFFANLMEGRGSPLLSDLARRAGDGDGLIRMISVRGSESAAVSFANSATPDRPSGVLTEHLKGDDVNRYGQGAYLTLEPRTGVRELANKGVDGSYYNAYGVDIKALKALDLTDKATFAEWESILGDNYQDTAKVAHRARMMGYNSIISESVRDPGHVNLTVIGDFDKVMKVSPNVEMVPSDAKVGVEVKTGGNVNEVGPPAARSFWEKLLEPVQNESGHLLIPDGRTLNPRAAELIRKYHPGEPIDSIFGGKMFTDDILKTTAREIRQDGYTPGGAFHERHTGKDLGPKVANEQAAAILETAMASPERRNVVIADRGFGSQLRIEDPISGNVIIFRGTELVGFADYELPLWQTRGRDVAGPRTMAPETSGVSTNGPPGVVARISEATFSYNSSSAI